MRSTVSLPYQMASAAFGFWHRKMILAPMVRVSVLPVRLLAHKYGAGIVYSPEIVDLKLMNCERFVNPVLGTIDFVRQGKVCLRTVPEEKDRLVIQIGTAAPESALAAASLVSKDCSFVDINCGCPVKFSTHAGMGSALLAEPDRLKSIIKALVDSGIKVTAKIRLLHSIDDTVDLVNSIVDSGISALAIHARTKEQRPREPADWSAFKVIGQSVGSKIPVIANGDIKDLESRDKVLCIPGISSCMVARAAQANPSIFSESGPVDPLVIVREYLLLAFKYCSALGLIKLQVGWMYHNVKSDDRCSRLHSCKSLYDIAVLFDLESEFLVISDDLESRAKIFATDGNWMKYLSPEHSN